MSSRNVDIGRALQAANRIHAAGESAHRKASQKSDRDTKGVLRADVLCRGFLRGRSGKESRDPLCEAGQRAAAHVGDRLVGVACILLRVPSTAPISGRVHSRRSGITLARCQVIARRKACGLFSRLLLRDRRSPQARRRASLHYQCGFLTIALVSEPRSVPELVEAYKNYAPPFDVVKTVRLLLRYVPAKYLVGLKTVVLTNQQAMSHDKRRQKLRSRGRKVAMQRVLGTYHQAWKGNHAWIELFVDKIGDLPEFKWLPLLRTQAFAKVLYHEIGHHIHKTSEPEYREREDVADDWGRNLSRKFMRSHYWYLAPVALVYRLVTKPRKVFGEIRNKFRSDTQRLA